MPIGLNRLLPGQRRTEDPGSRSGRSAAAQILRAAEGADEGSDADTDAEREDASAESEHRDDSAQHDDAPAEEDRDDSDDDEEEDENDSEPDQDEDGDRPIHAEDEDGQSARRRERARVASIVRHEHAVGRRDTALALALDTDMAPREAVAVLGSTPKGGSSGSLGGKMAGTKKPSIGPGGEKASSPGSDLLRACESRGKALRERRTP